MKQQIKKLSSLFPQIQEYFFPHVIGEVNDVYVKLARIKGQDVPWHTHDSEDELFYVVKGSMMMEIEGEESFALNEGELFIVNKGFHHRVYADEECHLMLIEQKTTRHTGDVEAGITRSVEEQLGELKED